MPTFKAVVYAHYTKADKTYLVRIRVTQNRKVRYINTGITAVADDLTKKLRIKTQAFIDSTNDIIKAYRDKCNTVPDRVLEMDVDQVISFLTDKNDNTDLDFIKFGTGYAEKLRSNNRKRTAEAYETAINALKRYTKEEHFSVLIMTVKFLSSFEAWIKTNPAREGNQTSMSRAPSHYLSSIRALHNEMKKQFNDEDTGIIRIPLSPFSKFKVPTAPVTKKRAVTAEIIKKISALEDEEVKNSKGTNRYNLGKDCFMLSFYLIGMNSADLFDCSSLVDRKILYKRKKTRTRRRDEAEICIYVQPEAEALIEKYRDASGKKVFNFYQEYSTESNFNKAINKGLKTVGKKVGVEHLEFYAARHSWATIGLNKVGIDKYTVHSALNHVDEEMKVTDIYLDHDWSLINNANRKVLDFVFPKDPEEEPEVISE